MSCLVWAAMALAALALPAVAAVRATTIGPAPATRQLTLVIPLVADDAGLHQFALAVSTPGSPLYGQFAPVSELAARFGARPAAATAVIRYLRRLGARQVRLSPTRLYVQATLSVAAAQRTFGARLAMMRDSSGQQFVAPAAGAGAAGALPAPLRGLATGVVGLDTQPLEPAPQLHSLRGARAPAPDVANDQAPSAYSPRTGTAAGCANALNTGGFTPNQYLTAYGYDALHNAGLRGGGERVAVIEIDGFKRSDLSAFGQCFGIHVPPVNTHTVGFRHPLAPGGETTLDLEVLSAAAPRLASIDVYENRGDAAHLLQAFTAPLIAPAAPQVISASLGICEQLLFEAMGSAGIQSMERNLELAASSGITFLAASGDQGSSSCVNSSGAIAPTLAVNYPASSWWVTGIGGTNFQLDAANHIAQEIVWNDTSLHPGAGGGGISGLFHRPPYQSGVVSSDGRAVPDVSLLADLLPGYAIFCTAADQTCGGWIAVGGTSAAAPLLAGGLALVDQDLAHHHREPLGLANPLLYALAGSKLGAAIFHDVTSIGNDLGPWLPGGGSPLGCCTAAAGYDQASGWGSLDLGALDLSALSVMPHAPAVSLALVAGQHPLAAHAIYARLTCSGPCRAYVAGFLVFGSGSSVLFSGQRRMARRGTRVFRIALSAHDLQKARRALASGRPAYAVLSGIALDTQGRPLAVSRRHLLFLR